MNPTEALAVIPLAPVVVVYAAAGFGIGVGVEAARWVCRLFRRR